MSESFWWWQDEKELLLWKKLRSMPESEINPKIKKKMTQRYGQIYWYQPFKALLPFHRDTHLEKIIHGNNSSGKSYGAAAETSFEVMGFSPYREMPKTKYAPKRIWVFSPDYQIQRSSSQSHLFAIDSSLTIGLLPPLGVIKDFGGNVIMGKNRCIDYVEFPDGTILEFKSMETSEYNIQAAPLDFNWFDEEPKSHKRMDEIAARLLRKDGRMVMSCVVPDPQSHWLVQDVFEVNGEETDIQKWFFVQIEDNETLTPEEIERAKKRVGDFGRAWRFSEGGKFDVVPVGERVYNEFSFDMHVREGLLSNYDPKRTLFRSWDLGFKRPAMVAFQLDDMNRRKYLLALKGKNMELVDFYNLVQSTVKEHCPDLLAVYDLLPHDANRQYDTAKNTAKDIFIDILGCSADQLEVTYIFREESVLYANNSFRLSTRGKPQIQIDKDYAAPLIQCVSNFVRDKDGEIPRDKYYEDISDAFKKAEYWINGNVRASQIPEENFKTPSYRIEL